MRTDSRRAGVSGSPHIRISDAELDHACGNRFPDRAEPDRELRAILRLFHESGIADRSGVAA